MSMEPAHTCMNGMGCTEHTVATANMAAKWEDFQQNKDLYPNVRYEAVNDERTRQKHREWDGFVAPLDHPIWKTMWPPNDFGCRCDAVQTDEPVSKDLPEANIKDTFKNNAAVSGKVFNTVPYADGMSKADKNKAIILAINMFGQESVKLRLKRYKGIGFEKMPGIKNKGVLELFTSGKQNKKEFAKNKMALTIVANDGHKYRMLPIIDDGMTNPDAYNILKKHFVDIKVITTTNGKSALQNALKYASKQGVYELVLHLTVKPDSYKEMYAILRESLLKDRNKNVKLLTVILPDGNVRYYDLESLKLKLKDKGKTSN